MKLVEALRLRKKVRCQDALAEPIDVPVLDFMRENPGMTKQEAKQQLDGVVSCQRKIRQAITDEELKIEAITCYIADQSSCPLGRH